MVIWLNRKEGLPSATPLGITASGTDLGVGSDIVRRDTFGVLGDVEAAYRRLNEDREVLLEEARREAQALRAAAREDAEAMREAARREYAEAHAQGFEAGQAQGLEKWFEDLALAGAQAREAEARMREQMARIVAMAVERIVRSEGPGALFTRALESVDRIVENAMYLRVTVHPDDLDVACEVFDELARRWREIGRPMPLSVLPDKRLVPGSCLCESDLGIIDASVTTQLGAVRAAISRAIDAVMDEPEQPGAELHALQHEGGQEDEEAVADHRASDAPMSAEQAEEAEDRMAGRDEGDVPTYWPQGEHPEQDLAAVDDWAGLHGSDWQADEAPCASEEK